MKNYIGFYVILVLLIISFVYNGYVMNRMEINLLNTAYELKEVSDMDFKYIEPVFKRLKTQYEQIETSLGILINHSYCKDLSVAIANIEYDMLYEDRARFKIALEELIFYIEEIKSNEKPYINNIL